MSRALAVLEALAEREVTLYADPAGTLRVRGPQGAYTPADHAAVDVHRAELVALLRARARPLYGPGDRPPGFLALVPHEHQCPGCRWAFKCTAPSCAGRRAYDCVGCKLAALAHRQRVA